MSEFQPVRTKADLDNLDDDEMVSGYMSGYRGENEPGNDKSRSFWHGWRNGRVDGRHDRLDPAQMQLARAIVGRYAGLQ
jgi:hypothetical protein